MAARKRLIATLLRRGRRQLFVSRALAPEPEDADDGRDAGGDRALVRPLRAFDRTRHGLAGFVFHHGLGAVGIRMALGATRGDVLRLVLGRGIVLTVVGLVLGLVMSLGVTRFLESLLLGVSSTDALTFLAVALLLSAVVLVACFIPARRAMRVDPAQALRYE